MKAFISWSGGKETSLAFYRVMQNQDIQVACLLNMISEDGRHSRSHGVSSELLRQQAEAIGIPIMQRKSTWDTYEEEFKKAVTGLKKQGIEAGVFGDIDVQEHRNWVERVCTETGMKSLLPLWHRTRDSLMEEFISAGFKAIVVAVKLECIGSKWIGRELDAEFVRDIKRLKQVDLCGENGEYHTFVYNGPIFKVPAVFYIGEKKQTKTHCFLEVTLNENKKKIKQSL